MEENIIIIQLEDLFKDVFQDQYLIINSEMNSSNVDRWDSLTHMILVTRIERHFSIKLKLKELNKMRNVGDMVELIKSKV